MNKIGTYIPVTYSPLILASFSLSVVLFSRFRDCLLSCPCKISTLKSCFMSKKLKQLDTFPNRLSSLAVTAGWLSWSGKQKNRKQYYTKINDCTLACRQTTSICIIKSDIVKSTFIVVTEHIFAISWMEQFLVVARFVVIAFSIVHDVQI